MNFEEFKNRFDECNVDVEKFKFVSDNFSEAVSAFPYEKGKSIFLKCLEISQEQLNSSQISRSYNMLACFEMLHFKEESALHLFDKAIAIAKNNKLNNQYYQYIGNKSHLLFWSGKYFELIKECNLIIKNLALNTETAPTIIDSYAKIGLSYKDVGLFEKAEQFLKESIDISKQFNLISRMISNMNNLSLVYTASSEYEKQIALTNQVLKLNKHSILNYHSKNSTAYNNLAFVFYKLKDGIKTIKYSKRSLDNLVNHKDPYLISCAYVGLASGYYLDGQNKKSLEILLKDILKSFLNNSKHLTFKIEYYELIHKVYNKLNMHNEAYNALLNYHEFFNTQKDLNKITKINYFLAEKEHQEQKATIQSLKNELFEKEIKISKLTQVQENKMLNRELVSQLKERERIAQNIHDNLGAYLTVGKLQIESVKKNNDLNKKTLENIDKAIIAIDKAYNEVRSVTHDLIKSAQFNVFKELRNLIHNINDSGIKVNVVFNQHKSKVQLNQNARYFIYKAVKELLTNSLKHAKCNNIFIETKKLKNEFLLIFTDNGQGFDSKNKNNGIGLKNLHQNVKELQGKLKIVSSKQGTNISISLPLN